MRSTQQVLTSFGLAQVATSEVYRPERTKDCLKALDNTIKENRHMLTRGNGQSYGDQALNDGQVILRTERLDRFLDFDAKNRSFACEAGVTFEKLFEFLLPKGFIPFAVPGSKYVTVGGAIANDIHGHNHVHNGSFGDHVDWIELLLPTGQVQKIYANVDTSVFKATVGGGGLTGMILSAGFKLQPTASSFVDVQYAKIDNFEKLITALPEISKQNFYTAAWIDGFATRKSAGRSILQIANFIESGAKLEKVQWKEKSTIMKPWMLNPISMRIFNKLYIMRHTERRMPMAINDYLFMLNRVKHWNQLYQPRGFTQFQMVVPYEDAERTFHNIMGELKRAHVPPYLMVGKMLGGLGAGFMSFPMSGFTMSIDLPMRKNTPSLVGKLCDITAAVGGRVYLAKDAFLSKDQFMHMYSNFDYFVKILEEVDPDLRMTSNMSNRLGIR